uniref:Immunoglobulin domain-containing protein n=1 Tax=Cyprinus carpio carpio TaxID=630221 RepID=A0A9J7XH94_CYPCA
MFFDTIIIHIVCVSVCYFTDLLIWCQAAETLTDQLTDLGQNVTINCDFDEKEVNWLLLKLPDSPVLILLSSTTSVTFYYNKTFKHKYSVKSKHGLFINNVNLDDLGLYYCVTSDAPPKYSSGTRLYITELSLNLENKNHTVMKYTEQNQTHWQIIILISAFINALLIIVVIGLVKMFVLGSKRTRDNLKRSQDTHRPQPRVMDLGQPQNSSQAQDAMVHFSTPCKRFQPCQINDTYAFLQLPESITDNNL